MDKDLTLRAIEALETYQSKIVLPWRMTKDRQLIEDLREAAYPRATRHTIGELPEIPADFPVQPLSTEERDRRAADGDEIASCETCNRSWDDSIPTAYTPAPSGRCPFEAFHA